MVQTIIASALNIQKNKIDVKVIQSFTIFKKHLFCSKLINKISLSKLFNCEQLLLFLLQIIRNCRTFLKTVYDFKKLPFQTGQEVGRQLRWQIILLAVVWCGHGHCSPQGQQAGQACSRSEDQHGDVWKEISLHGKVQGKKWSLVKTSKYKLFFFVNLSNNVITIRVYNTFPFKSTVASNSIKR